MPWIFWNSGKWTSRWYLWTFRCRTWTGLRRRGNSGRETQRQCWFFVTSMAQYAVHGYEVDAMDYIVKPLNYFSFSLKMKRAVKQIHSREKQQFIINTRNGLVKTSIDEIKYVEVLGHKVIYHLEEKDVEAYGSMKKVMEELPNNTFALCNNCYYVNLYYVTSVEGYLVSIGEIQLQISHPRKKSFMKALNDYVGGCSA